MMKFLNCGRVLIWILSSACAMNSLLGCCPKDSDTKAVDRVPYHKDRRASEDDRRDLQLQVLLSHSHQMLKYWSTYSSKESTPEEKEIALTSLHIVLAEMEIWYRSSGAGELYEQLNTVRVGEQEKVTPIE